LKKHLSIKNRKKEKEKEKVLKINITKIARSPQKNKRVHFSAKIHDSSFH